MSRRSQFIIIPALSVILAGLVIYFFFFHDRDRIFQPAAMALPESAVVVYQGSKIENSFAALRETDIYSQFISNPAVMGFDRDYDFFDSLLGKNDKINRLLIKNPLLISLHVTGTETSNLLFLNQTENAYNKEEFFNLLKELNPELAFSERNFEGQAVFDAKNREKVNIFSFCFLDGILALSRNTVLVEDAVNAYKDNNKKTSVLIDSISANYTKERIYINYSNVPALISTSLSPSFRPALESLQGYSGFGIYELSESNDKFQLKGVISGTKSSLYPDIFEGQEAQAIKITDVIPSRTAVFIHWGISDFQKYSEKYLSYGKEQGRQDNLLSGIEDLSKKGNFDFSTLYKYVRNEWAYTIPEKSGDNDSVHEVLTFAVDTSQAGFLDSLNSKLKKDSTDDRHKVFYRGFVIIPSSFENLPELLFGRLFSRINNPWYCMVGGYAVFSRQPDDIKHSIDAFLDKDNLAANAVYSAFATQIFPRNNLLIYINPERAYPLAGNFLRDNLQQTYKSSASLFSGIDAIGMQISGRNSQLLASRLTGKERKPETLWQLKLEAEAASPPTLLKNFDGTKSIFITDENHTAYLISGQGRVLWKKRMDAQLSGDVSAIDLYENENTQYLFSSKNTLYLVDRDGRDVGNYPLKLGSRSTSGIALFDFNEDKNYNYFIGTQNNRVYGYAASGRPLPGWNPQLVDAPLVLPMKYFKIKKTTYLFGVSNRGTLYVWKTNGERAIKPIELKQQFVSQFKINFGPNLKASTLISMDTSGTLYKVKLNGDKTTKEYKTQGSPVFFDYLDADGNGKNEYIISGGNIIASYEKEGKKHWKINAVKPIFYAPQFFTIKGENWIGYVPEGTNQVYLVNRHGEVYANFPLAGNMPFIIEDMNNDGSLDVVTATTGKKVMMYRLNR